MEIKKFKKRLSETKFLDDLDFEQGFKIMVDAPTGSGKTFYIIDYLKKHKRPFVFLCDTLLLMKQIAESYNVDSYCASDRSKKNEDQIITVYNHIDKFWKDKVVIVDEAHSLISDFGFKRDVIDTMLAYLGEVKHLILLSGTPLMSKDDIYKDMRHLKFDFEEPIIKTLNIHRIDNDSNKLEYAVQLAIDIRSKGKTPIISLLDTDKEMSTLSEMLKINGFDTVGLINSITKSENEYDLDASHYKELVANSSISADCILTTYVQGYNINNENCSLIILPTNIKHSYVAIAQMMARCRKAINLETHLVDYNSENETMRWDNFERMQFVIEEGIANRAKSALDEARKNYKTDRFIKRQLNNDTNLRLIDTDFKINCQLLSLEVSKEISELLYANLTTANSILNQYNIKVKYFNQLKIENIMKCDTKQLDHKTIVENYFMHIRNNKAATLSFSPDLKKCHDKLKDYGLLDSEIEPIMMDVFGNTKAYNRVIAGLEFRKSNEVSIKNIRKDLYRNIKTNKWYSSSEVYQIVSKTLKFNKIPCNSKKTASEVLNYLYYAESEGQYVEGKKTRGFRIKDFKL